MLQTSLSKNIVSLLTIVVSFALLIGQVNAKAGPRAPDKQDSESQGPYTQLILRGVNVITGEGAPARGPVDIVVEQDRIVNIVNVGHPDVPIIANRPVLKEGWQRTRAQRCLRVTRLH